MLLNLRQIKHSGMTAFEVLNWMLLQNDCKYLHISAANIEAINFLTIYNGTNLRFRKTDRISRTLRYIFNCL